MIFFVPLSQIRTYYETKETKNQICSHLLYLLVCPVGISGGWSPEIPDIGGLLRVVRIVRGCVAAIGYPSYVNNLQVYKRT